jgi:hypothetical protein
MSSNDYRETVLTLGGVANVIRTERTARQTVAALETAHTKAVKAAVTAWRASVGKPKALPNHTRGNIGYVDCRKGDAPVRYTTVDPAVLVADMPGVTYEEIDPNAPAPVVEAEPEEANPYAGMTLADMLEKFFTPAA